jgi:formate dehydrogenase iron-sulfur subunit
MSFGILFDSTMCIGCEACSAACKEAHDLPGDYNPDRLDANTFTLVREHEGVFYREFCRHCLDPACVSACLVGALQKTSEGPVIYDAAKCIGCRYCLVACPFSIPCYEWERSRPLVRKCDFCIERLRLGKIPACADVCPTRATKFGKREELLREAHERIKLNPDIYYPRVFGEDMAGGTSVLFIADRHIAQFGLKVPPSVNPLPDLTWQSLNKVPAVAVCTGAILAGAWVVFRRKKEVADAEAVADEKDKRDKD